MNYNYNFLPENTSSSTVAIIELTDANMHVLFYDKANKSVEGVVSSPYQYKGSIDHLSADLRAYGVHLPLSQIPGSQALMITNVSSTALVPASYDSSELRLLLQKELLDGEGSISEMELFNSPKDDKKEIFELPAQLSQALHYAFPGCELVGAYAAPRELTTGNELFCRVEANKLFVRLYVSGALHLYQSYDYINAEDALYCLLQICKVHQLQVADVQLKLGGGISADSVLYNQLHNYFLHTQLRELPEGVTVKNAMISVPVHYYAHLLDHALCV